MDKIEINLALTFKIPDEGINVNGLLYGLKKANSEIMLGIVKTFFEAFEQKAIEQSRDSAKDRLIRYGHQRARTLRTSFGPFKYRFAKLKNMDTRQILIPLREALQIPKYRQYQNEAMEPAIGLSVHLSYNRSDLEVDRILGSGASRWTVWRRLHEFSSSQCHFQDLKKIPYIFLLVDGTKVQLQGPRASNLGKKEMRWALVSKGVGHPFDFAGIWIAWSWEQIAEDLKDRLSYENLEVLLSDGGPGIIENLLAPGMRLQRCTVHAKRDFPYILYQDGLKKKGQREFVDFLNQIPALSFSKERIEKLTEKDKENVREICERTETDFSELIDMLDPDQYPKARTYVQNLAGVVTTFFQWWLDHNEWIPFTTNLIENRFSQVKNRIKRIGRRWSDKGLLKWLMVVIEKIFYPENWDDLWKQYLQINQPLHLVNMSISYRWCLNAT
jgi:hypothetical protein